MADETEGSIPAAGGQLSGEATRAAAVRRLEAVQNMPKRKRKNVEGPEKPFGKIAKVPGQPQNPGGPPSAQGIRTVGVAK